MTFSASATLFLNQELRQTAVNKVLGLVPRNHRDRVGASRNIVLGFEIEPPLAIQEFTPTQDGDLSVIEVGMGPLLNPNGRNAFAASIRVDADGKPDLVLESIVVFDKVLTTSDTIVRFVSVETPYLDSSRIYWLVLEPIDDFFSAWATNDRDEKGTEASSTDMGMSWSFSPLQTLGAFRISVVPVPTLTCSGFESPFARGPVTVTPSILACSVT